MIAWLKAKKQTVMLVIGAILLALAGAKASKRKASADRKEKKIADLMHRGVETHHAKANRLIKSADKHAKAAAKAKKDLKIRLEKISAANSDIDSVVNDFKVRTRV